MGVSESFKSDLIDWLEANCPPTMRAPLLEAEAPLGGRKVAAVNADTDLWMARCAERGLTLPAFPPDYGGAGLSLAEMNFFYEELERRGMRIPLMGIAVGMLAPTLLQFGTDAQKAYFLPRIARGEDRWAQSFSEPNAGSDLAALQLQAVRDGDDYVLTGQKIWNSWADKSEGLITLVRTSRDVARRQDGISFLLVNADTPGVTIRPIRMINGDSEFCEVFFDEARVPVANRVGEEGSGWPVVKGFLIADRKSSRRWYDELSKLDLVEMWRRADDANPQLAAAVLDNELDALGARLLLARIDRLEAEGCDVDAFASVTKYWQMEHVKRRYDLASLIGGWSHSGWSEPVFGPQEASLTRAWLYSKANSIGGGSSEVQLNILAKHVLQLPRG